MNHYVEKTSHNTVPFTLKTVWLYWQTGIEAGSSGMGMRRRQSIPKTSTPRDREKARKRLRISRHVNPSAANEEDGDEDDKFLEPRSAENDTNDQNYYRRLENYNCIIPITPIIC